ncbi:MAG: hypothetical protein ACKODT_07210 [Fluviibacter sp.]
MKFDDLITPADVEREMIDLTRRLENAPGVIKEYHTKVRVARNDYKKAYALAFSTATGTQMDRKIQAELSTAAAEQAVDDAEIEYRFVVDTMDALKSKLRALQSVSSLMKASMFGNHGGV